MDGCPIEDSTKREESRVFVAPDRARAGSEENDEKTKKHGHYNRKNENEEGKEEDEDKGQEEERDHHGRSSVGSFFSTVRNLFKACGMMCAIGCPPVPEIITRKLAFHPPVRGSGYTIHNREDHPDKKVDNIKHVGKNFVVRPVMEKRVQKKEYDEMLNQTTPFTVKTREGNTLVCVQCATKCETKSDQLNNQVIIFAQPNSSDLGGFMHPKHVSFYWLADAFKMDVYAFDYSGYGYSTGQPSEKNLYADIHAVYDYVKETRPNKKICLIGYSIGTSAVTDLASLEPPGLSGVVLIAPFTSGIRLVTNDPLTPSTCCLDRFTNTDKISEISVPVLLIHGSEDPVIPHDHSLELHKRLKFPVTPLIVHGADHQSIFNGRYVAPFNRIFRFLRNETRISEGTPDITQKTSQEMEMGTGTSKENEGQD